LYSCSGHTLDAVTRPPTLSPFSISPSLPPPPPPLSLARSLSRSRARALSLSCVRGRFLSLIRAGRGEARANRWRETPGCRFQILVVTNKRDLEPSQRDLFLMKRGLF
jgi:hypothetical protein